MRAALPSTESWAGRLRKAPADGLGIAPFMLARAGTGQAVRGLEEDERGQEYWGGGCFPPQRLEAFQRQQET